MAKNYVADGFKSSNDGLHFGGIIYSHDFDTNHAGSRNMANRIIKDWAFDQFCQRNSETRKKCQKNKGGEQQ